MDGRKNMNKEKKKNRITRASANSKARWLQNRVCELISRLLNLPWGYEDDKLIQPRIMGQKGVDIILRGEAYERFTFDSECKNCETWSVPAAIRQAKNNTKEGRNWLVFMKKKEFKNPVVILDAYIFFDLLKYGEK